MTEADHAEPGRFYNFIDYIEQTTFGIACDAQANFRVRKEGAQSNLKRPTD